jgi:hypothetical protein
MTRRDAETSVSRIYLDWATDYAEKARDATDPLTKIYYHDKCMQEFRGALRKIQHEP